jgi:hypothetical protein
MITQTNSAINTAPQTKPPRERDMVWIIRQLKEQAQQIIDLQNWDAATAFYFYTANLTADKINADQITINSNQINSRIANLTGDQIDYLNAHFNNLTFDIGDITNLYVSGTATINHLVSPLANINNLTGLKDLQLSDYEGSIDNAENWVVKNTMISAEQGNMIVRRTGINPGLFASSSGVPVSGQPNNMIATKSDGLFVGDAPLVYMPNGEMHTLGAVANDVYARLAAFGINDRPASQISETIKDQKVAATVGFTTGRFYFNSLVQPPLVDGELTIGKTEVIYTVDPSTQAMDSIFIGWNKDPETGKYEYSQYLYNNGAWANSFNYQHFSWDRSTLSLFSSLVDSIITNTIDTYGTFLTAQDLSINYLDLPDIPTVDTTGTTGTFKSVWENNAPDEVAILASGQRPAIQYEDTTQTPSKWIDVDWLYINTLHKQAITQFISDVTYQYNDLNYIVHALQPDGTYDSTSESKNLFDFANSKGLTLDTNGAIIAETIWEDDQSGIHSLTSTHQTDVTTLVPEPYEDASLDIIPLVPVPQTPGIYQWTAIRNNDGTITEDFRTVGTSGIPTGGTTGEVLKKQSDSDFDMAWEPETGGVEIVDTMPSVLIQNVFYRLNDSSGVMQALNFADTTASYITIWQRV